MRRSSSICSTGELRYSVSSRCLPVASLSRSSGFSLIEVVMATAFLMGSAIVLSKLAGMGREQSQKARVLMHAQQLCEQTIDELLLGLRPMEIAEGSPLLPLPEPVDRTDENEDATADLLEVPVTYDEVEQQLSTPEWRHSIRMEALPDKPGMWALTVVVIQGDEALERPVRFSLTRWIAGPPSEGAFDELMSNQNSAPENSGGGLP